METDDKGYTITPEGRVVVDLRELLKNPAVQEVFEIAARIVSYDKQKEGSNIVCKSLVPKWVYRYSEEQYNLEEEGWYESDSTTVKDVELVYMVPETPVPFHILDAITERLVK